MAIPLLPGIVIPLLALSSGKKGKTVIKYRQAPAQPQPIIKPEPAPTPALDPAQAEKQRKALEQYRLKLQQSEAALEKEKAKVQAAVNKAAAQQAAYMAQVEKAKRLQEALDQAKKSEAAAKRAAQAKATGDIAEFEKQLAAAQAERKALIEKQAAAKKAIQESCIAEQNKIKAELQSTSNRAAAELEARKKVEAQLAAQEAKRRTLEAQNKKLKADAKKKAALAAQEAGELSEANRLAQEALIAEREAKLAAQQALAAMKKANNAKKNEIVTPEAPSVEMTGQEAALALREYLIAHPTRAAFGYKDHPSEQVKVYQVYLGVTNDGIVGQETRTACRKYGVELPARSSKPAPKVTPTPAPAPEPKALQAAKAMKADLEQPGSNWGKKGYPNPYVKAFQQAAGLTDDGIFGPATRQAAANLGVYLWSAETRRQMNQ